MCAPFTFSQANADIETAPFDFRQSCVRTFYFQPSKCGHRNYTFRLQTIMCSRVSLSASQVSSDNHERALLTFSQSGVPGRRGVPHCGMRQEGSWQKHGVQRSPWQGPLRCWHHHRGLGCGPVHKEWTYYKGSLILFLLLLLLQLQLQLLLLLFCFVFVMVCVNCEGLLSVSCLFTIQYNFIAKCQCNLTWIFFFFLFFSFLLRPPHHQGQYSRNHGLHPRRRISN